MLSLQGAVEKQENKTQLNATGLVFKMGYYSVCYSEIAPLCLCEYLPVSPIIRNRR